MPSTTPSAVRHHVALPNGTASASTMPTTAPAPKQASGMVQQFSPGAVITLQHGLKRDIGKAEVTKAPSVIGRAQSAVRPEVNSPSAPIATDKNSAGTSALRNRPTS